jgi:hypothetical protein
MTKKKADQSTVSAASSGSAIYPSSFVIASRPLHYIKSSSRYQHIWSVRVRDMECHVVAPSHQAAKKTALAWWPLGCGDPTSFAIALRQRIAETGIHAKLLMRDYTVQYL